MIPRVAIDTNIFVSDAITGRGKPASVLDLVAKHGEGIPITPTRTLKVSPDEADNRFLECADAPTAD